MSIEIEQTFESHYAMKGSFGGVSYYMCTLPIDKVADSLHFEKDLHIVNPSFAERIQRTLNQKRAEDEIYKGYLLNEGTRFFNSLVVSILPNKIDKGFYKEEQIPNSDIFKLELTHDVKKVVVDGQHRLFALRKLREDIISGKHNDRDDLKNLQIPIIFVLFDNVDARIENTEPIRAKIIKETRRVFTALNKTAKKIDKYTTLILDDSDFSAVVSRKVLEEGIVDELDVKWAYASTALTQFDVHFTTLNIVNEMIEYYCQKLNISLDDEDLSTENKSQTLITKYFENVVDEIGVSPKNLIRKFFEVQFFIDWKDMLNSANIILLKQPEEIKMSRVQKEIVKKTRQKNLLAQVVGQIALFTAIVESLPKLGETPNKKIDEVCRRVNILLEKNILKKSNQLWTMILVGEQKGGNMLTKKQNVNFASLILELLLTHDKYNKKELTSKVEDINKLLSEKLGVINRGTIIDDIIQDLNYY